VEAGKDERERKAPAETHSGELWDSRKGGSPCLARLSVFTEKLVLDLNDSEIGRIGQGDLSQN